ncbi:hypothetical protein P7C70_g6502, partial [Phenoliferia sp. Uapishka_3]
MASRLADLILAKSKTTGDSAALDLPVESLSISSEQPQTPSATSTSNPATETSTEPTPPTSTPSSSSKPLIVPFPPANGSEAEDGFLYVPAGSNDLVIIDELANLDHTASWPVWSVPPPPPPAERCFYIETAEGKGMGMFASRPIKKGELIIEERPLFVTRLQPDEASDGTFEMAALKHLNPSTRERFLSLSNAQDPHINRLPGILLTNLFAIDFDYESSDEHLGGGVYEFICRANQDCVPSTHYHFNFKTFTGRLFATRDISKGEEISVTYAALLASGATRRRALSKKYRFDCLCPTCTLPEDLAAQSDARRAELSRFDTFVRGGGMPSYPMLMDALKVAEKEGLASERAHVLLAGTKALSRSRQLETALDWATKTREAFELLEGPVSFYSTLAREHEEALEAKLHPKA